MIRTYSLFCKIIHTKISSQSIFSSFMKDFNPALEVCPFCGSKHNCHPFAFYHRHLVDFIHGHISDSSIQIFRVQCSSCHHTHAILPDVIIPYASYSLFFILRVISEYFLHLLSVDALCQKFHISHSLLYKWLDTFYKNKALWLGALQNAEVTPISFILSLCRLSTFSSFSKQYFLLSDRSFLQSHTHSPTLFHLVSP